MPRPPFSFPPASPGASPGASSLGTRFGALHPSLADLVPEIEEGLAYKPEKDKKLTLAEELAGREETAALLKTYEMPTEEELKEAQEHAKQVLKGQKQISILRIPPAVQALRALLDSYDFALIEDNLKIRNYVVNRLIEESANADPKIRLRAVELLGKVTEVAAFTERTETTIKHLNQDELNEKLQEKLENLMALTNTTPKDKTEDAKVINQTQTLRTAQEET